MPDEPSPAQIKFFRRLVRRSPELSVEEALDRWRAAHGEVAEGEAEALRKLYDEQQAARLQAALPDPNHGRIVMRTIVAWIGVHTLLLAALAAPSYAQCTGQSANAFASCGISIGLTALAIGLAQLVYGVIAGAVLTLRRRTAIAQGLFISAATVAVLFTAVCFGAAFTLQ
jgi:hypothetical protein